MKACINALIDYAVGKNLIDECDRTYCFNRILNIMKLDYAWESSAHAPTALEDILELLTDYSVARGVVADNITARDLFDTELMSVFVPFPHEVRRHFNELYKESPEKATDWFYSFSCDTNYIRRDRIKKDLKWVYSGKYGDLDITVNLSKPEKDPRAIAAAKLAPQTGYPACLLCAENEGYAGRMNHPGRGNHRPVPVTIANSQWYFQYSPYVYYNEHCIVFNSKHVPMKIDRSAFGKLLDFVTQFPHYFVGSNADLPIVGGSILSHDHFQGGRYEFAMARATIAEKLSFKGFEDVDAGIVDWPMSVIRLTTNDRGRLEELADKILTAWRAYTDESAFIYAETEGEPHNTITPIARRRGEAYQLDLVLRNNITTPEHPLGVYHPHEKLHHIKKENIGLIEVMGLAVLPSRLKKEIEDLVKAVEKNIDISQDEELSKHAQWLSGIKAKRDINPENAEEIIKEEIGLVFQQVLEDAGVYKRTAEGMAAFRRFTDSVK